MVSLLLALLLGVVAGLRAMAAPAAASWLAHLGLLHVGGTSLAFLGSAWARWLLTLLALAAIGAAGGAIAGIVGAVIGTLGGAAFRARLARALSGDHAAALVEDTVAVAAVLVVGVALR
jgi:uncharacterized membrane protein